MNKEISVYELLGLIKDGKAPKKIKEYQSDGRTERYCLNEKGWYTTFDGTTDMNLFTKERLNDKVEILEEDKPIIEKIKMNGESFYSEYINSWIKKENSDAYCEYLSNKLNEIIDYINRKEDK